ncbi:dihydroneopterin aldolase [Helicobacter cholecystus]|uniref:Dihydroneopterin aldolase n=1 Tax=Helicobacter cholecystus TaxID=45498 RepID=A0A3D8IYQ7_9HELI|nr:dihydroneopterin aldolase [Helicobacter cholecystus]RDU70035.1 dihydroneopterin aldolase [Helicobacter cholecystus]VEJ24798.1 putative dihydroneopterin aldolase [Helicobacter cholecystus]
MTLLIENLSFKAIVGILPSERVKEQNIIINAEFSYEYKGEYLNYVEIVEFLKTEFQNNAYGLLEEALEDLKVKIAISFPSITHYTLSIKKPEILSDCVVGVKISI